MKILGEDRKGHDLPRYTQVLKYLYILLSSTQTQAINFQAIWHSMDSKGRFIRARRMSGGNSMQRHYEPN